MRWLELKLPPLALFALVAIILMGWRWPEVLNGLQNPILLGLSLTLAVLAALLLWLSVRSFRQVQTTVMPMDPSGTSQLVVNGIYRYSRNPMYLAMTLLLMAEAMLAGSPFGWMMIVGFMLWLTRFQIQPEERILQQRFGRTYTDYCLQTRRWL